MPFPAMISLLVDAIFMFDSKDNTCWIGSLGSDSMNIICSRWVKYDCFGLYHNFFNLPALFTIVATVMTNGILESVESYAFDDIARLKIGCRSINRQRDIVQTLALWLCVCVNISAFILWQLAAVWTLLRLPLLAIVVVFQVAVGLSNAYDSTLPFFSLVSNKIANNCK